MANKCCKCNGYSNSCNSSCGSCNNNYSCCKPKCCCVRGPQGPTGPEGPQGPAGQLTTDFAQVFDSTLTTVYTAQSFIQLALNSGDIFENGGFSLTSTQVPNDTINFPETGVYLVNAQFIYSFLPDAAAVTGDVYILNIDVNTTPTIFLPQILLDQTIGIPAGGAVTIGGTEAMNFIVNVTTVPFALSFELQTFSFALADNGELNLSSVAIDIVQLDEEPIT